MVIAWLPRAVVVARARKSAAVPCAETKVISIGLDTDPVDYDDPLLQLMLTVERSDDGGLSWQLWASAVITGGTYAQDGSLPTMELTLGRARCTSLIRTSLVPNKPTRIGLTGGIQ